MSKIDMSMKMCIQNLVGFDTMVMFRAKKHGGGFRYYASEWRKKLTKPNGINHPDKRIFVYCPDQG
ncbi:hypothetical protein Hanom_Chr08g00721761 [Helianthus anomalus]